MKPTRDAGIECLRIALMLGICILHSATHAPVPCKWLSYALLFCVNGFVFISGYYGVRFSLPKIGRLLAVVAYALLCTALLNRFIYGASITQTLLKTWLGLWFVHAYIIMMAFAPLVDSAIGRCDRSEALKIFIPILAMIFGWGWFSTVPLLRRVVPLSHGFVAYSPVTLIGVYIVARLIRTYLADWQVKKLWLALAFALLMIPATLGYARYNSPFAVALAFCAFYLFKGIHLPSALSKIATYLAPSMFTIYAYHSNESFGFRGIKDLMAVIPTSSFGLLSYFLVGLIIFIGGGGLDLLRRLTLGILQRCLRQHD